MSPELISMKTPHDSEIPVASVCFMDLGDTLCGVHHALHECLACGIYYRDHKDPPMEVEAIFMERFYLDDAALRLYAAGEHLAKAITFMLELTDEDLQPYRKTRVSQQSIVAAYLRKRKTCHVVTCAVAPLGTSREWQATVEYRNKWVHEQPPTVAGLGLVYHRRKRWDVPADGGFARLSFGGGDEPEHTIEEVRGFVEPSLTQILTVSQACFEHYVSMLKQYGVSLSENGSG